MITNKHIDKIIAAVMALAVILTGAATVLVKTNEAAAAAFAYSAACSYEHLFDPYKVMEIDIAISEGGWEAMMENPLAEAYQACDVTVNGKTYANVAIRTKGNTSLSQVASSESDRYSFKVEFDHYASGQSLEGLDKLVLNNIFCDATYLKEYMAYDIFRYLGVAVPYYCFAHITINGEEWGLYLALEAMEESYVARVYGTTGGQLYKPESVGMGGFADMEEAPKPGGMPGEGEFPESGGMSGEGEFPEPGGMPGEGEFPKPGSMPGEGELPEPDGKQGADGAVEAADDSAKREMPGVAGNLPENGSFPKSGGMHGPDAAGGGSDLVYTDDDTDSYADIFDNAAFDPTEADKERVVEALRQLSLGEQLEAYFDVDACLRYFAAQTFIVNMDSYYSSLKHNYYLYEEDGQLTILPWDLNLAFGGFQAADATDAVNSAIDTPMGGTLEEARPMFAKLMAVPDYQERYHQYLEQIVAGYVGSGQLQKTFDAVTAVIDSYVQSDATAFYGYEEYREAVANLKQFILLRSESVAGQLDGTIPSETSGQEASDALVDASSVSLSAMGVQGGDGAGGKGSENGRIFGGGFGGRGNQRKPR